MRNKNTFKLKERANDILSEAEGLGSVGRDRARNEVLEIKQTEENGPPMIYPPKAQLNLTEESQVRKYGSEEQMEVIHPMVRYPTKNLLWRVLLKDDGMGHRYVSFLERCCWITKGEKLKEGDFLKFGRTRFRVKEFNIRLKDDPYAYIPKPSKKIEAPVLSEEKQLLLSKDTVINQPNTQLDSYGNLTQVEAE